MKRILVIGSGGAGKSTFARRLGDVTGIEVIHLDKLYWQTGWVETPKDVWLNTVENLLEKKSWILDGNFGGTVDLRIEACDTIVFLDLPKSVCLYRVVLRRIKFHNSNRPDMTVGCNEKIDLKFLGWIWNYRKQKQAEILEKLNRVKGQKNVYWLKSQKEIESFFKNEKLIKRFHRHSGKIV